MGGGESDSPSAAAALVDASIETIASRRMQLRHAPRLPRELGPRALTGPKKCPIASYCRVHQIEQRFRVFGNTRRDRRGMKIWELAWVFIVAHSYLMCALRVDGDNDGAFFAARRLPHRFSECFPLLYASVGAGEGILCQETLGGLGSSNQPRTI